jgi:hypothetical protein
MNRTLYTGIAYRFRIYKTAMIKNLYGYSVHDIVRFFMVAIYFNLCLSNAGIHVWRKLYVHDNVMFLE